MSRPFTLAYQCLWLLSLIPWANKRALFSIMQSPLTEATLLRLRGFLQSIQSQHSLAVASLQQATDRLQACQTDEAYKHVEPIRYLLLCRCASFRPHP